MPSIDAETAPALLADLFAVALDASRPNFSPGDIAQCGPGPLLVVGAGKAAASMARAFEQAWNGELRGAVITRHGFAQPTSRIEVIEASHPFPTTDNRAATDRLLALISSRRVGERVVALVSGGGSALLCRPITGVSLAEKSEIARRLMDAGADIRDINLVRRHLSQVKGGGLAQMCAPNEIVTFAISDVVGDEPADIASGPTVPVAPDIDRALAILQRYKVVLSDDVRRAMLNHAAGSRTAVPKGPFTFIATPRIALDAVGSAAKALGIEVVYLGAELIGEARDLGRCHAERARQIRDSRQRSSRPCIILSGGEATVTRRGNGSGGPNTEYLAGLMHELKGAAGIYAVAGDSDGIDGSGDNAGAVVMPSSWERAGPVSIERALEHNDCYALFRGLGDLLVTGPTFTNVNDVRIVMVI